MALFCFLNHTLVILLKNLNLIVEKSNYSAPLDMNPTNVSR